MRLLLQLSFDGTGFHGWQKQLNAHSVQQELDHALSTLLREEIETVGCGRTDSGVHAAQFFLHFDCMKAPAPDLVYRLNKLLPASVAVQHLQQVSEFFHARFDADYRVYHYHLHTAKDPFAVNHSWYYPHPVNMEQMNAAAQRLLTHTDFQCFSKSHTQVHTYNCTISEAQWQQTEPGRWLFRIKANRFLRNMVRAVVGTLLEVGRGEMTQQEFAEVLHSGDRSKAGLSVPAHALFLQEVHYPPHTLDLKRKEERVERNEEA